MFDSNSESEYNSAESDISRKMSDFEIKRLQAAIRVCQTSIGRFERLLARTTDYTVEDLLTRKENLIQVYRKFEEHTINLLALGEAQDEEDDQNNTEERYLCLLGKIDRMIKDLRPSQNSQSEASCGMAKLPSLDIPIFDGKEISSYKPFIEMFQAVVHQDSRITAIQKLCFLKKYLKGEPLHLIDSLPIVGESYEPALELLKKRYDNPALLVNSHVNSLLDLQCLHKGTAQQLRDFVASVRQHVAALKNLKQPVNEWNAILSNVLIRKLDSYTVRLFHSDRDTSTVVAVEELLVFLDKRAASLEASSNAAEKSYSKPSSRCVNLAAVARPIQNSTCSFCSKDHKLFKCPEYSQLSPGKRNDFVVQNKLCKICLTPHDKKCRYNFKCNVCHSSHHNTLIHVNEDQPAPKAQEGECEKPVNMHVTQPATECTLLPTAKVLIVGANNKRYTVKALLDSGSQTSFCTTALAKQLRLPQQTLHKNIATLGDNRQNVSTKIIHVTMESLVHEFQMDVTCSVIDKITSKLPKKQMDLSKFVISKHVALADNDFHIPGEISLLLSSDVFFKIIQDGKIEGGPADPILLNTRLGYIVSSTGHATSNTTLAMHTVIEPELDHCVRHVWEAEKVPDVYPKLLSEHEYSEEDLQEYIALRDNTFEVKFPLKVELQDVDPSNSYAIALQRLYNLEKIFSKNPVCHDLYKRFIQECLELGHAKTINTENYNLQENLLIVLKNELISFIELTSFRTHKWISNGSEFFADLPQISLGFNLKDIDEDKTVIKILGWSYDAKCDEFCMNGRAVTPTELSTKRSVLSSISRLYDSMGLVGPVTMKAKLILQELWHPNLELYTPLPSKLDKVWQSFYANLVTMHTMIARYVLVEDADEVHPIGCCDASSLAYGGCFYIKVKIKGHIHIHLLCSKFRLAGTNSTIPKLICSDDKG